MSGNINPERVNPAVLGGAQAAARSLQKITSRYEASVGMPMSNLSREADAKELRLIADAAIALAKELK